MWRLQTAPSVLAVTGVPEGQGSGSAGDNVRFLSLGTLASITHTLAQSGKDIKRHMSEQGRLLSGFHLK